MEKWQDIPTQYSWDGDSLTSKSPLKPPTKPAPPKTKPAGQLPHIPASALVINEQRRTDVSTVVVADTKPSASLSNDEKQAVSKMEAALEKILGILGEKQQIVQDSSNLATGSAGAPLWDSHIQELSPSSSPIYPDGRPVTNPNHLMLFLWNGAELVRSYAPSGWVSKLRRADGKMNPVPETLVEAVLKTGYLRECGSGVFKAKA